MNSKKKSERLRGSAYNGRFAHEMEGVLLGALAGGVLGAAAGPPGILAGAIIGAIAGIVIGATLDTESARRLARARKLDAELGASGEPVGPPQLVHRPASYAGFRARTRPVPARMAALPLRVRKS